MAELKQLGAQSVPVVSRGDQFVFAQVIKAVVDFLGLKDETVPELSPYELKHRYDSILETATSLVQAMPDDKLDNQLPNRPRSWRVLMHHLFQIPVAFLDMEDTGEMLTYEKLVAPPPEDMMTSAAIAEFGNTVRKRFKAWADKTNGEDFSSQVSTYFGGTSRHEMLERTVWHSTQHIRQVGSLLKQTGVTPKKLITAADIKGLPLTDKIWDKAQA